MCTTAEYIKHRFAGLHFEITHRCNLRCRHCYNIRSVESQASDLSLAEVKKVLDIAAALGCRSYGLSGGEPFTRPDILEIIKHIHAPIRILTNGLLLTEDLVAQVASLNRLIDFRVSLDGTKSHRKQRGVDFERVIEKIQLLKRHNQVVTVNTMFSSDNACELEELFDRMIDLGVDRWRIDFVFEAGNAAKHCSDLSYTRHLPALLPLIERHLLAQPTFQLDINKMFRSSVVGSAHHQRASYSDDSKPCSYQGALTVRANGDVSFCPSLETTFGNILTDSLEAIVENMGWSQVRKLKVGDINGCKNCELKSLCGGGCRADAFYSTGSLFGVDKATCDVMRFHADFVIPTLKKYFPEPHAM
jgi:radical SAM protein with 4Fe4S-binding SPASM domain